VAPLAAPAPAPAQSATATITRIDPTSGAAGGLVSVAGEGCLTPIGQPASAAELFVRGPGPTTNSIAPVPAVLGPTQFAVGLDGGRFMGLVRIPAGASVGSTYMLSARCIAEGQPQGPESQGAIFTVTELAPAPSFDAGRGTATTSGVASSTGAVTGGAASPGRPTTGGAKPILAQPHFTG